MILVLGFCEKLVSAARGFASLWFNFVFNFRTTHIQLSRDRCALPSAYKNKLFMCILGDSISGQHRGQGGEVV